MAIDDLRSSGGWSTESRLPRFPAPDDRLVYVASLLVLALAYFGAAKGGLALAYANSSVTAVWAPTGIALAAVLLFGYRMLPGVLLGAFLANVTTDAPFGSACGIAIGNTLEALTGAFLISRVRGFQPSLDRVLDVAALVFFGAVLSTMVSATIGVASLWAAGAVADGELGSVWRTWWFGDMGGDLLVAPALLVLASGPRSWAPLRSVLEAVAVFGGLAATAIIVVATDSPLLYVLFPALFWIGARYKQAGAVIGSLLVAAIGVWLTHRGHGPFVHGDPDVSLLRSQLFFGVGALTALLVAAATAERQRIESARYRLAAIVESSDDAIVGKALDGTIVDWNKGAERLYGYSAAEAIGQPISMLTHSERADEVPGILDRIRRGERIDPYETVRRTKDGRDIEISLTVSPVKDADGKITGASAISRDISEKKRAERQLRELSAQLEQRVGELAAANAELESFSYSVSHDLRAPLRAIDGFSRAVVEDYGDALDEDGRQLLARVRAGSQRMGELIDELLALSQLTRKEFSPRRVDLTKIARQVASDLQAEAPDRSVDLVFQEGVTAQGDPELLRVAIMNLLGNAWKFTSESAEPRIEFGRESVNGRSAYVVRDNGAGFDMRYAEKLFRPFERLHREDEFPGLGVGLTTVQRIVRRHGGTVWAQGRLGEGAAFFFDLPERNPE